MNYSTQTEKCVNTQCRDLHHRCAETEHGQGPAVPLTRTSPHLPFPVPRSNDSSTSVVTLSFLFFRMLSPKSESLNPMISYAFGILCKWNQNIPLCLLSLIQHYKYEAYPCCRMQQHSFIIVYEHTTLKHSVIVFPVWAVMNNAVLSSLVRVSQCTCEDISLSINLEVEFLGHKICIS